MGISNFTNVGQIDIESEEIIDMDNDMEELRDKLRKEFYDKHMDDLKLLRAKVFDGLTVKFGFFIYYM